MTTPSLMVPDGTPFFSPTFIPTLPSLSLTDDEKALIERLQMRSWRERALMQLTDAYYRGVQVITNLQIAIPPELAFLRTIVGWPRIAVDPLVERWSADGFRLAGALDCDPDLEDIWLANHMDSEQSLLYTDALVMGRGWILEGSPAESGDPAVLCVESPLNIAATWDLPGRKPKALLQSYWQDDRRHAALYMPDQTIHVAQDDDSAWKVVDRDEHGLGFVPAVRLANAARTHQRDGASEITPEVMSITDAACRTLLGLEIAREFYSVPQKLILGASEADFVDAEGNRKSVWDTYVNHILALQRDENGELPTVHQFTAYDPSVFTKLIEMYAGQMGGVIAANPQELGLYTQGNPVSSDGQDSVDRRRVRRATHKQRMSAGALIDAMKIAVMLTHAGTLPAKFKQMSVDWMDPADFNLASVSDAMLKQESMGAIPGAADVVRKRLGWSTVERQQLEQAAKQDAGEAVLAELAHSLEAKDARTDLAVAKDITGKPATPPASGKPA